MGMNGYSHRSSLGLILAFIDGFLIFAGVLLGGVFRFWEANSTIIWVGNSIWKIIVFNSVIQIVFYYFDLYELRNFRARVKTSISLLASLGTSFIFLAIIYYFIPDLTIGRGVLAISLILVFLLTFLCRLIFTSVNKNLIRERILIVGTGNLAKKVTKDINENRQDAFEIIGFVGD